MTPLTPEDRDALRELAAGATPGPWMFDRDQRDGWMVVFGGNESPHGYNIIGSNEYLEPADAAFIAASREAVPSLLRDLELSESERNLTAIALAQAVIRADKADAKVLAVEDALVAEQFLLDGEMCISVDSIRRALSVSGRA